MVGYATKQLSIVLYYFYLVLNCVDEYQYDQPDTFFVAIFFIEGPGVPYLYRVYYVLYFFCSNGDILDVWHSAQQIVSAFY